MNPSPEVVPAANNEKLNVLVVDDDTEARESLELAVRRFGHSCTVARDGLEALEMQEANRADIILSDWSMPRMDGVDLCRKIRAGSPDQPYTHFIFVTGNSDDAHLVEGMRAGADDYLTKPIDIDDLEARLVAAGRRLRTRRRR